MASKKISKGTGSALYALVPKGYSDASSKYRIPSPESTRKKSNTVVVVIERDTPKIDLPEIDKSIKEKFDRLVQTWRMETGLVSSVSKKSMHPAYQKIIGMGEDAIPLILEDLQQTHDHWLWALYVITDEDAAKEGATFIEAVDAWLEWGKEKKYLE